MNIQAQVIDSEFELLSAIAELTHAAFEAGKGRNEEAIKRKEAAYGDVIEKIQKYHFDTVTEVIQYKLSKKDAQ